MAILPYLVEMSASYVLKKHLLHCLKIRDKQSNWEDIREGDSKSYLESLLAPITIVAEHQTKSRTRGKKTNQQNKPTNKRKKTP